MLVRDEKEHIFKYQINKVTFQKVIYCEYLAQWSVSGDLWTENNVAEAQNGDQINIHKEQKQHMR